MTAASGELHARWEENLAIIANDEPAQLAGRERLQEIAEYVPIRGINAPLPTPSVDELRGGPIRSSTIDDGALIGFHSIWIVTEWLGAFYIPLSTTQRRTSGRESIATSAYRGMRKEVDEHGFSHRENGRFHRFSALKLDG